MISITIVGRTVNDMEVKASKTGQQYLRFSVASDRGDAVDYMDCYVSDERIVKFASDYVKKGSAVVVNGVLVSREYEGKRYWTCFVSGMGFAPTNKSNS